jgi:thioredoxin-dependent peroxiredoxin
MGVQRATLLIDPEGVVRRVWPKVRPEGHAAEVLAALGEEQSRPAPAQEGK